MYTKKMLSIAAVAAIMSTGALAFDTDTDGELLTPNSANRGAYDYNMAGPVDSNNSITVKRIKELGAGQKGDALIFPAFFAGGNDSDWHSEFSVINTSNEAVVAKVVLYGALDSIELRDFNIYLSAHDVFRAKLEKGKIIAIDGSTILPGSDNGKVTINEGDNVYGNNNDTSIYKYNDDGEMVSKDKPLDIFIDPDEEFGGEGHGIDKDGKPTYEHNGYIAVFAMVQANKETYHKKHKELWQDYRHLVDTCRSVNAGIGSGNRVYDREWRSGITRGLYNDVNISTPNRVADMNNSNDYYRDNCQSVYPSVLGETKPVSASNLSKRRRVDFKSPDAILTGSILVSNPGTDGKGSRDLLIEAYALDNVTDKNGSQILLWSEGEFAHIADRCIDKEKKTVKDEDGNKSDEFFAGYNESCVTSDAEILNKNNTYYEFRDNVESQLIVTQPYKRILLQRKKAIHGRIMAWNNLDAHPGVNGEFKLKMKLYNDDEDNFIPVLGGFTVSPATTTTSAGIPNELSKFDPFSAMSKEDREKYSKGYSFITYQNGTYNSIPAIISQMAATINDHGTADIADDEAETNWIYPLSN